MSSRDKVSAGESDTLLSVSAVDLRRMIGTRELSPVELTDCCIAQIERFNPAVNAVVTTCFERARAEASRAEQAVRSGVHLPPLHGIPLLVKDLSDTAAVKTSYGSLCFKDNIPLTDSAAVARLRSSGAIVLGKTNTPEFGAGANTANKLFGPTNNPFNPQVTCGGSSGGSAVALACDMAPLATGSDLGGSLRIPASFCSVVGMRPTPGLVPSTSHVHGFSPLWTDGPMGRSVADVALCLQAMVGYDQSDPLSHKASENLVFTPVESCDLSELVVGFSTDLGVATVDTDIAAVFDTTKQSLTNYFSAAHDLPIDLNESASVFRVLRAESLYASFGYLTENNGDLLSENVRNNILEARTFSLIDTADANARHTQLFRQFQTIFDQVDVLVCPATAVSPFPIHRNCPEDINGVPLDGYYAWYAITWALSLMGCPIVTIPYGLDHRGMPFGIQIVGPRHSDASTLSMALALEQVIGKNACGRVVPDFDQLITG